jgi:[ribosomal protein S5]-alanine N-acetyltransferase
MKSILTTKNLILSAPSSGDLLAINDFETRNHDHLKKLESTNTANSQSAYEEIQKRLGNWIKECEEGKSARFFIRPIDNPSKIIGFCNFTQIFHGSFQACYLGYKIDGEYEGKGLMFEALEAAIRYVFEELAIHRIMANYMPINTRSAKLLNRLGFTVEGYAKNYLLINCRWEDHVLTALSIEQWQNNRNNKVVASAEYNSQSMLKKPRLIPELSVIDFKESLDFYTRLAGFKILYERPENDFAMLEIEGAQLMIEGFTSKNRTWLTGQLERPFGRGIHLQIEVQDIVSLYQIFKNANYPIFFDMEEQWYQIDDKETCNKQFLVQDPDGYLLRFFEHRGVRQRPCV